MSTSGSFDLSRGPLVVGVVDGAAGLSAAAVIPAAARPFDLVEARVDLFGGQRLDAAAADACRRLESTGTPVLITIRAASQGGRFTGPDSERLELFRQALAVASWADVEDDAALVAEVAALVAARPTGRLIVSHHDFTATPPLAALLAVVDACHAAAPGAGLAPIAKVATAVKTPAGRTALFQLLAQRPTRTAIIGMDPGDDGLRVALAAAGSLLAYGFLGAATAPGQVSAAALENGLRAASPAFEARRQARAAT